MCNAVCNNWSKRYIFKYYCFILLTHIYLVIVRLLWIFMYVHTCFMNTSKRMKSRQRFFYYAQSTLNVSYIFAVSRALCKFLHDHVNPQFNNYIFKRRCCPRSLTERHDCECSMKIFRKNNDKKIDRIVEYF